MVMAEAKTYDDWTRTSAVLALLANAHRDPKKAGPYTPSDFHPLEARRRKQVQRETNDLSILRTVFVEK